MGMRSILGICLALGILAALIAFAGCYPHTCSANDTSCLPCPDPRTTNPACAPSWQPIPIEAKSDGGNEP